MTPDPAPARPPAADAVGWFEFITPVSSLTRIAYVRESGEAYLPEGGDPDDFVLAASYGQVWRLVREEAAQPPPPASEAERVLAGLVAMHFNTDGVIYHSSFRHVQVESMWEDARRVVEAAQRRLEDDERGREL